MFKKLKIKFVMTNIVSITTILVIIFFGIYLSVKAFLKTSGRYNTVHHCK